jgi:hypothetical protein
MSDWTAFRRVSSPGSSKKASSSAPKDRARSMKSLPRAPRDAKSPFPFSMWRSSSGTEPPVFLSILPISPSERMWPQYSLQGLRRKRFTSMKEERAARISR